MTFEELIEKLKTADTDFDCAYASFVSALKNHKLRNGNQFDYINGFLWGLRASKFISEEEYYSLFNTFMSRVY